jgi:hypothetical protein
MMPHGQKKSLGKVPKDLFQQGGNFSINVSRTVNVYELCAGHISYVLSYVNLE